MVSASEQLERNIVTHRLIREVANSPTIKQVGVKFAFVLWRFFHCALPSLYNLVLKLSARRVQKVRVSVQ